ncbi:M56 family metallopeptidase [Dyadobacter psychrotolerans]|uniref:M56 family metallopeptidase n=1 Tax=Dyadobacter psychrotolerans TaxID=2541721 RepID=A0A4V2Z4F2_9BACT|nr:M56 family metallopeptidase [Dyadobacter psychrotolerans]TDE16448.1 M56 family metallopeptidase [Dyadobacter psychrotolerans]
MLFPYLIKVSFLLGVLTLCYRWLIQFETFSKMNRLLLIFNVAAAWSIPLLPLPDWGPVAVQKEFHQSVPGIVNAVPLISDKVTPVNISKSFQQVQRSSELMVTDILMLIYLSVVLYMTLLLLYQIFGLFLVLLKQPSKKLDTDITLIFNRNTVSPFSFFKWIVLNPDKHCSAELQHILAHETEHARQLHSLDLLLAEIQRIVLWFNPFAWSHRKLVQGNLEFLADRAVLKNGVEKKQYQFSLLKVALQTKELPLTNSFAQSLLKKRIKMMNRKPSGVSVFGKYALLIVLLYVSSAFVAPYQEQIIELLPEVKPVLEAVLIESKSLQQVPAPETIEKSPAVVNAQHEVDEKKMIVEPGVKTKSKWVLVKGDTLYWAISPLLKWQDINLIKEDVQNFGGHLDINRITYDPLQLFITSLAVHVTSKGASGEGSSDGKEGFNPSKGYSGFVMRGGGGLGMGQTPPAPLSLSLENDYQKALDIKNKNEVTYFEKNLTKSAGSSSGNVLLKDAFLGKRASFILEKQGIGKSDKNTLKVTELLKKAEFYINAKPASFEEINNLNLDDFISVNIIEIDNNKKYISVTKK